MRRAHRTDHIRSLEIAKLRQSGRGGPHDDAPRAKVRRDRHEMRKHLKGER